MGFTSIFLFQYQFSCTMLIFRYISSQKISDLRDWLKTHRVTALPNFVKDLLVGPLFSLPYSNYTVQPDETKADYYTW